MKKTFAFIMDPLEHVNKEKDTTYSFICESLSRGIRCLYIPKDGLSLENNVVQFNSIDILSPNLDVAENNIQLAETNIDAVFVRTDPPFDNGYLLNTWLLSLCKHPFIMNDPAGIRSVNEKIYATQFSDLTPKTIITKNKSVYENFLKEHKKIILKPLNGYGGQGIFIVEHTDTNRHVTFETLIALENGPVMCQTYIPEAGIGDKRILLLDGEPLGAVLRVHNETDHRNNFFAGGQAKSTKITDRDLSIIKTITPHLKSLGLHFVGIDIIGDYLIEINVTSPTCLQEMNRIYCQKLEKLVIDYVMSKIN